MCSMWLPAVFGEITSRFAIPLFDRPCASRRSTSTSRGEPRRALAPAAHPVARGAQHRIDGVAVEPPGAYVGAQLQRRVGGCAGGAVGPRLAHRLIGVGG